MNTANKTLTGLMVGLCLLTILTIPLLEPLHAQKTEPQWQNSFTRFIDEVTQWEGRKPKVTLQTFIDGQVVPSDEWEIMKKYGVKPVRWTAIFDAIEKPSDEHPKQGPRVKLKVDMGGKAGSILLMPQRVQSLFGRLRLPAPGFSLRAGSLVFSLIRSRME